METIMYYFRKCERCMGAGFLLRDNGYRVPCYMCMGAGRFRVVIDSKGNERRVRKN